MMAKRRRNLKLTKKRPTKILTMQKMKMKKNESAAAKMGVQTKEPRMKMVETKKKTAMISPHLARG